MYALRGQGCSIALLADAADPTQYTTQAGFGLSEGCYMILTGPAGDNITNAVATKQSAGLDTYACKRAKNKQTFLEIFLYITIKTPLAKMSKYRSPMTSINATIF